MARLYMLTGYMFIRNSMYNILLTIGFLDNAIKFLDIFLSLNNSIMYEGRSKITEPYPITFELSKMDIYLDDISLKLYVIYLIT